MRYASIIFLGMAFMHQTAVHGQDKDKEGFSLVKREGIISIYERWFIKPGSNPPVKARELKGEFTYRNTIYAGLHLLKDQSMGMKWQSHLSEYKIYPHSDTTTWFEYSYHDIPWPVSDQDHFMEFKLSVRRPGTLVISFKSKVNKTLAPERKGAMRMQLVGSWTLEQVTPTKVKVTYKIISKPLDIPKVFTDPIVRNNIITTFQEFIALLEK